MITLFKRLVVSTALFLPAILIISLGVNLWSYTRLTGEQLIATVNLKKTGEQRFMLKLSVPGGDSNWYEMAGDEWQLDVRMIKWRSWFSLLGNDPIFRLERLGGRYQDTGEEISALKRAYTLTSNPGVDLWMVARKHARWLPTVEAVYGSAVYLPMRDGARYKVLMSRTGLTAQSLNAEAESAIENWPW